MLTRRGNRKLNVTGTGSVSGNLNGVQFIIDIFVGSYVKQHCKSIGVELEKVEHLTAKCEWYKAYKISLKVVILKN